MFCIDHNVGHPVSIFEPHVVSGLAMCRATSLLLSFIAKTIYNQVHKDSMLPGYSSVS